MGEQIVCSNCLSNADSGLPACPYCGQSFENTNPAGTLPVNTLLAGRYTIGRVLALDGEGVDRLVVQSRWIDDGVLRVAGRLREPVGRIIATVEGAGGRRRIEVPVTSAGIAHAQVPQAWARRSLLSACLISIGRNGASKSFIVLRMRAMRRRSVACSR